MAAFVVAGTMLKIMGQIEEGREVERRYEEAAKAKEREAVEIEAAGMDTQADLLTGKTMAIGSARARGASAGVTGGIGTRRISSRYEEYQRRVGRATMFRVGEAKREAREFRRRGRFVRESTRWGVFGSILGGAASMGGGGGGSMITAGGSSAGGGNPYFL